MMPNEADTPDEKMGSPVKGNLATHFAEANDRSPPCKSLKTRGGTTANEHKDKEKAREDAATGGKGRGRRSSLSATPRFSRPIDRQRSWAHRTIVDLGIKVPASAQQGPDHLVGGLATLLENLKIADPTAAFSPFDRTSAQPNVINPKEVPENMTRLQELIECNLNFTNYGNKSKDSTKTIYGKFVLSCDRDPVTIINKARAEFFKVGGMKLQKSALQVQQSVTSHVILFVSCDVELDTLQQEFNEMLAEGAAAEALTDEVPNVPETLLKIQTVLIPKQKTSKESKAPRQSMNVVKAKKAVHIEVGVESRDHLNEIIETVKALKLHKEKWGKMCHITEALNYQSKIVEIRRMQEMGEHNINYMFNMTVTYIAEGMGDVDGEITFTGHDGQEITTTGRQILMSLFTFEGTNKAMVSEVHQAGRGEPVALVHFNNDEAEQMMASVSKHPGGVVHNLLKKKQFPAAGAVKVMKKILTSQMCSEATQCEWDPETYSITTKEEQEAKERNDSMRDVKGFRDIVAELKAFEKKEVKAKVQAEYMFDLEEERSVKTVHPENDGKYDAKEVDSKRSTRKKAHDDSGDSQKKNADDGSTSSEESGSSVGSAGKG
mmetsp:Transcript_13727/g.32333  ORF Transcript_13727/g.32333 Transcript_13727/m.32333 type:complete len:605 (-) Transcript_13727:4785-6599(-)